MSKLDTTAYDAWMKEIEKELEAQNKHEAALVNAQHEAFDKDLKALVTAAQNVVDSKHKKETVAALAKALEQFIPWMEDEDANDPRANGWVDDKGRP